MLIDLFLIYFVSIIYLLLFVGMTVKKVVSERFTPISYQIFLFYYSGNVLGYTISRKDNDYLIQNLIL
jgi:hypothetical protein